MGKPPITPEERYQKLSKRLLSNSGVTQLSDIAQPGKGFGSSGLRINNKIFAMLSRGRLVVKLPPQRVNALIASGDGDRFDPGHGRLIKEWFSLKPTSEVGWLPLAEEAMGFVASKG